MALFRDLRTLRDELKRLEDATPGNWLGHWAKSIKLKSIKSQISAIECKLEQRKSRNK